MKAKLPNLELLEYQAVQTFLKDEEKLKEYIERRKEMGFPLSKKSKLMYIDLSCELFKQVWGSTCTAFDVDEQGCAVIAGQAMTEAYTVVFFEPLTETYIVFIDNRPCYIVSNANEKFINDLKERNLESLSRAKLYY